MFQIMLEDKRLPALAAVLSLVTLGCGAGRPAQQAGVATQSQLLVERINHMGGPPHPVASFITSHCGDGFIRLYDSGLLYYGIPNDMRVRLLGTEELKDLVATFPANRFAQMQGVYDLQRLKQGRIASPSSVTFKISTGTGQQRQIAVSGSYGNPDYTDWMGLVPAELVKAAQRLDEAATGGIQYLSPTVYIAAYRFTSCSNLNGVTIRPWSVAGIDLEDITPFTHDPPPVSDPLIVEQLHAIFSGPGKDRSLRFSYKGSCYMVMLGGMLP